VARVRLKPVTTRGRPLPITRDPITIGRHPDNVIRIRDERASRFHCVVEVAQGKLYVRDLGSRNGTCVNGNKIETPAKLRPGDMVIVGSHEFLIELMESADAPAAVNGDNKPRGAKQRAIAEAQAAAAENAQWMRELGGVVEAFGATQPRRVVLIDAGGKDTNALDSDSPGPAATKLMLVAAIGTRATDIHFEPRGEHYSMRMRVDGQMVWVSDMPNKIGALVSNMVKSACLISTQPNDAVIDGHFSARFEGGQHNRKRVEYRVSFTPTVHGPKVVLRVLDAGTAPTSLDDLGMPRYMIDRIRQVCEQDSGLLLVCGPTGSGKTTTLYNGLREIDRDARNVVTIEDPVEYQLDNTTQIPVNSEKGHTFGEVLRSVLRQDPDVILVGEVRDEETARTAMQAAMTGHLVFSTVHSKDSISSVFRLLDLGVEPYLVANSLQLVLAQRLVRVLCPECKRDTPVLPAQATKMGRFLGGKTKVYGPVGCERCLRTGYAGRRAIFELLDVDDDLRDVILNKPTIQAMKKVIEQGLFTTLQQSGWKLVAMGETSVEEVDRVASASS